MKKIIVMFCLLSLFLAGCGNNELLYEDEISAFEDIYGGEISTLGELKDITKEVSNEKFEAVAKCILAGEKDFLFIVNPLGYEDYIKMAVAIDGKTSQVKDIRIIKDLETEEYVRDFHNSWFTKRFMAKDADKYLKAVRLEAKNPNEIVAITGATVTTRGVINGVNSAIGAYSDYTLGTDMADIDINNIGKDDEELSEELKEGSLTFNFDNGEED